MINKAKKLSYTEIKVGDSYSFSEIVTADKVYEFARLTGDYNPLHVNLKFGKRSIFGNNIAHGMFVASFFSKLIGMYCPGERSLYLSQTLNFRKPVFFNDKITVNGTVTDKADSFNIVSIKMEISKEGIVLVDGIAMIKVLPI
ncbi:MAG: MaoC family dehydratase [Patescibacteria group bacterium]